MILNYIMINYISNNDIYTVLIKALIWHKVVNNIFEYKKIESSLFLDNPLI